MRIVLATLLWATAAVAIMLLVSLPISPQAHLGAVLAVIIGMAVLRWFNAEGLWRLIAMALGTSMVLRYVYWRTTSTLPPVTQLEDFIPGLMLYLAEMYNVVMLALSVFVVARPLPSRPPAGPLPIDVPTVDVFIPTYNEEPELLTQTLAAARSMIYPPSHVTVWLLDDGGTDEKCNASNPASAAAARQRRADLQQLCSAMGVRYLTRERNVHAKAGNLNNGLAHSRGELAVVFDADHAPARSFLQETVGYFMSDPKLFLVQTPHFFINPDPLERNLGTFRTMPSENEMFYGLIQRGLDKWNAAFFCGSAAVLRREALLETEGFSGISITEDAETALELHSRGWRSVYVDRPLIAGLQPQTFASFIGQRSRWAQGMMQIIRFRFPALKPGLTLPQRICYLSSTLFWLFPFARVMFLIAPLFYLFFSLEIFIASAEEFVAYTSIYMVVNMMMQNYLYGSYRWPWVSELYEFIQAVFLVPALATVIANPRKPTFKVTAKTESLEQARISELGLPFFLIFALLVLGVVATVVRLLTEPFNADITLVVGAWNILNLLLVGCALGVISERSSRRQTHRVQVQRPCELHVDGYVIPGLIRDVSVGGAGILLSHPWPEDLDANAFGHVVFKTNADLESNSLPCELRKVTQGSTNSVVGCRFAPQAAVHYRLVADLVFSDASQWSDFQASRRRNIGVLRGSLWFLGVSVYQIGRGLSYLLAFSKSRTAAAAANR
jgi:cellulose synthase (UDP-forming)